MWTGNKRGGLIGSPEQHGGAMTLEEAAQVMPNYGGLSRAERRMLPNKGVQPRRPRGIIGSNSPMLRRPEAAAKEEPKGIFGKGGAGWHVLGNMGDVLLARNGIGPIYGPAHRQNQALQARKADRLSNRQWQYDLAMQKRAWDEQDETAKRNAPQSFMSGPDRVQFDPVTGESKVIYDGERPFEAYAAALGVEPGTPQYTEALQDYVLKSSGPTAHDYDVKLDNVRTQNDIRYKGVPTYRQANPKPLAGGRSRGVKMKKGERSITTKDGQLQVIRGGQWVDAY